MYEVSTDLPYEGIEFDGRLYVKDYRDGELVEELKEAPVKKILRKGNDYYLVDYEAEDVDGGILLSKEDYLLFRQGDIAGINRLAVIFFLVILLTFLFNYIQEYILNYTGQRIIFNIRRRSLTTSRAWPSATSIRTLLADWLLGLQMIRRP